MKTALESQKNNLHKSSRTFSQNLENEKQISHANMHVGSVKDLLDKINEKLDHLRNNKENIKALVKNIEERGDYDLDQVLENLKQVFEQIYQNFAEQISIQKQENEKLQQFIVDLKKEKTQIQQLVINCAKKCTELEQDLGRYPLEL